VSGRSHLGDDREDQPFPARRGLHQILDRLSGIEDIWLAASTERYETADRLGREYSDELRLLLDDLGWGDGPEAQTVELTTAPDVLRRVFGRLRDTVAEERAVRQEG
jgi:hypothetical protein